MALQPDSELTTADLFARHWTTTLIKRFLPTPDGKRHVNHWANYQGTNTYFASRVWAVEQSDEFAKAFLRSWKGRMKKQKPEKVLEELRGAAKPDGQATPSECPK
jgi:hypothetical protein